MMIIALTIVTLAGLAVLAGLAARCWIRDTARFVFAPDADDEWGIRVGPDSGPKRMVEE